MEVKLFPIKSYKGVGQLKLGMKRERIRSLLGKFTSFMKAPTDKIPTDAFDDDGIHIYYQKPDKCEAIELFQPASPTFRGRRLIGRPYKEVKHWIVTIDPNLREDGAGFVSETLGFGVYSSSAVKEPENPIESVIVFRRGYYGISNYKKIKTIYDKNKK